MPPAETIDPTQPEWVTQIVARPRKAVLPSRAVMLRSTLRVSVLLLALVVSACAMPSSAALPVAQVLPLGGGGTVTGKILFQSEGAELFFRKIQLQPLSK